MLGQSESKVGGTPCGGPPWPERPRGGRSAAGFRPSHTGPACREPGLPLPVIYVVTDWDRANASRRACRCGTSVQVEADAPRNREDGGRAASRRRRGCRKVWAAGRRHTLIEVRLGAHDGGRRRDGG